MSADGFGLPTPSQSGIEKSLVKEGKRIEESMKNNLKKSQRPFYFHGKKIKGKEIVVSVLKNAKTEVKLWLIEVKRGSAQNIYNGIKELIDKFLLFGYQFEWF